MTASVSRAPEPVDPGRRRRPGAALHITDLFADLLANHHEFPREFLVQAGDSFGHDPDLATQALSDDVGVSLDVLDLRTQPSATTSKWHLSSSNL